MRLQFIVGLLFIGCVSTENTSLFSYDAGIEPVVEQVDGKVDSGIAVSADIDPECAPAPSQEPIPEPRTLTVALQPLTFWRYSGNVYELQDAMDGALARIRAATCLPLDVSYTAAHWIRQKPSADMGGWSGMTWGSDWNNQRIAISTDQDTPEKREQVLLHEILHVLRRNYGHSTEDGSMTYPVTHVVSSWSKITANDLLLICAKQPCGCQIPE